MPESSKYKPAIAIVTVAIACFTAGFMVSSMFYQDARIPSLEAEVDDYRSQLVISYEDHRNNFVNVALAILDLKSPHEPKILDKNTIAQASRCYEYLRTLRNQYDFLKRKGVDVQSSGISDLGYSYLESRILIYMAMKDKSLLSHSVLQNIEESMQRHADLIDKFPSKYNIHLRDHLKQQALVLTAKAELLHQADKPKECKDTFKKAIEKYNDAIDASKKHNKPKNELWVPAWSAICWIYEMQAVYFRDQKQEFIDGLEKQIKIGLTNPRRPTTDIDDTDPLLIHINAAELYMILGDLHSAWRCLVYTEPWCNHNEILILNKRNHDKYRKYFNCIKSLKLFCNMRLKIDKGSEIRITDINQYRSEMNAYGLHEFDMMKDMLQITFQQIKAIHLCNIGNYDGAKRIQEYLVGDVNKLKDKWYSGQFSGPRLIMEIVEQSVISGISTNGCKYGS